MGCLPAAQAPVRRAADVPVMAFIVLGAVFFPVNILKGALLLLISGGVLVQYDGVFMWSFVKLPKIGKCPQRENKIQPKTAIETAGAL